MNNKFLKLYNLILEQSKIYKNQKIAFIVGSFKPPHKGHWQLILNTLKEDNFDKLIVFISNISEQAISNRSVSLTNLKSFIKIQEYIDKNFYGTKIYNLIHLINLNIKLPTLIQLKQILLQILDIEKLDTKLNIMITKYLTSLQQILFKNIRRTINNTEITPEISKQIFELYTQKYNLQDKIEIKISNTGNAMKDAAEFINNNCFQCLIVFITSNKGNDIDKWGGFQKVIASINNTNSNKTNILKYIPINMVTNLSASQLRNNINNLTKDYFPDKLSENDINYIKKLLVKEL